MLVAPVLPGLSDSAESLGAVVEACTEAGASNISGGQLVYLKPGTREVFLAHLAHTHPHLLERYETLYRGVYPPRELRQEVSRRLGRAIDHHRGRSVSITAKASPRTGRHGPARDSAPTPARQLDLFV